MENSITEVQQIESRLRKRMNLLIKRSWDTYNNYRRLAILKQTPVTFKFNKELKEDLTLNLDKPKGIKETRVTKSTIENKNIDQRLKDLLPKLEKYSNILQFIMPFMLIFAFFFN